MRAVVQRVARASVAVDEVSVGEIGSGVVVLVGVTQGDGRAQAEWLADKVVNLRIFRDEEEKMNRSLRDVGGEALVVSQFTLYGDARKGRRPSFVHASQGEATHAIYEEVVEAFHASGVDTKTGRFGAMMQVSLVNDGPVTILLDSDKLF